MTKDKLVPMSDERLAGLIHWLATAHIGGYVNYAIQRDEMLSLLLELKHTRDTANTAPHPAEA